MPSLTSIGHITKTCFLSEGLPGQLIAAWMAGCPLNKHIVHFYYGTNLLDPLGNLCRRCWKAKWSETF